MPALRNTNQPRDFKPAPHDMTQQRFRLDQVQHHRHNLREQRRQELLEAQRAEDQVSTHIAGLQSEIQMLRAQSRTAIQPGALDLARVKHAQRYEQSLRAEMESAKRRRQSLAEEVSRRREMLIEADRESKLVDKVQERAAQHRRTEQTRREAIVLTDYVSQSTTVSMQSS